MSPLTAWRFTGPRLSLSQACWKSSTLWPSLFQLPVNQMDMLQGSMGKRTTWARTAWTLKSRCPWTLQTVLKLTTLPHSTCWPNTDIIASKWLQWPMLELENIHAGVMPAPSLEVRIFGDNLTFFCSQNRVGSVLMCVMFLRPHYSL